MHVVYNFIDNLKKCLGSFFNLILPLMVICHSQKNLVSFNLFFAIRYLIIEEVLPIEVLRKGRVVVQFVLSF